MYTLPFLPPCHWLVTKEALHWQTVVSLCQLFVVKKQQIVGSFFRPNRQLMAQPRMCELFYERNQWRKRCVDVFFLFFFFFTEWKPSCAWGSQGANYISIIMIMSELWRNNDRNMFKLVNIPRPKCVPDFDITTSHTIITLTFERSSISILGTV